MKIFVRREVGEIRSIEESASLCRALFADLGAIPVMLELSYTKHGVLKENAPHIPLFYTSEEAVHACSIPTHLKVGATIIADITKERIIVRWAFVDALIDDALDE